MRAPWAIITWWTVWPLMSMPRMARACSSASSAVLATLTPPALPRPPVLTCALTTVTPPLAAPMRSAAARASSGVVATAPASTGTPCFSNTSRAWYSKRSTRRSVLHLLVEGRWSAGEPNGARRRGLPRRSRVGPISPPSGRPARRPVVGCRGDPDAAAPRRTRPARHAAPRHRPPRRLRRRDVRRAGLRHLPDRPRRPRRPHRPRARRRHPVDARRAHPDGRAGRVTTTGSRSRPTGR